jgi:hypothetical protein
LSDMAPTSDSDNSLAGSGRSAVGKVLDSLFIPVQLCLAGFLLVGAYVGLLQGAWIPHRIDTFVWIQGDWQVGEYRSCQLLMPTSRLFCGNWDPASNAGSLTEFVSEVNNDEFVVAFNAAMTRTVETDWTTLGKYFHVLPVIYRARIERPGSNRAVLSLLCLRKDDALACNTPN